MAVVGRRANRSGSRIGYTTGSAQEALKILSDAGFTATTSMDEVVQRAVELARQA
jgi:hypothetical protein